MRSGKVKIKPITNGKASDECFSKCRQIIIKKANELGILCGVHVAVAVVSSAGKYFWFGYPTVQAITHRLLSVGTSNPTTTGDESNDSGDETDKMHELNLKYQQLQLEIEVENKRNIVLQQAVDNEHGKHVMIQWLAIDVTALGQHGLEAFESNLNIINVYLYHVAKNAKQTTMAQPEMNFPFVGQNVAPMFP